MEGRGGEKTKRENGEKGKMWCVYRERGMGAWAGGRKVRDSLLCGFVHSLSSSHMLNLMNSAVVFG